MNLLLCEGAEGSPDARILKRILAGQGLEILPMGGKYGMGTRILARRESHPSLKVAGLLDGDFCKDWSCALFEPRPWESGDGAILFGWRWSRKEIENYLIDPHVVANALQNDAPRAGDYRELLEGAADKIFQYQAARTALSNCRRRFKELPSTWCAKTLPDDLSETGCRQAITQMVTKHAAGQAVETQEVLGRFEDLLPEFRAGGVRRRDFLWTFSGTDLLLASAEGLRLLGFPGPQAFEEKVLLGIEATLEDIATWLAEWAALRDVVLGF